MEAIAEYSTGTCVPNTCTVRWAVKAWPGSHTSLKYPGGLLCTFTRLETLKVYSPASPDRIAPTPKKHTQRQEKEIWQLPQKKQNGLIHSSNIIYKVPEEHHKRQLTDLKKTARPPAKIQNVSIKKKSSWSKSEDEVYESRCIQDRKVLFFPIQIVLLKSPPRRFFLVKKLLVFFPRWNFVEAT